jgi:rhamnulokinase
LSDRAPAYAACDLGAESGRVVLGSFDGGRVELRTVQQFENVPVRLHDGLHWNLLSIMRELLDGLRRAAREAPLAGIGVDSWGVDYGLLDGSGRLLGLPFHYRDPRTVGMVERAHARVPRAELYATTGIQTMPINTVFQLLAEEGSAALGVAERIALVPDLLALWLTGEATNERTNASTTGLLDARSGEWAWEVIDELGLPRRLFGELIEPGTEIGSLLHVHTREAGINGEVPVLAAASHDTASAFVAAPVRDGAQAAILSSGTWSLLGMELPAPVLDERALEFNLTNERGVDGTTRLLRNVMGLWLLQECRRAWGARGARPPSYEELARLAAEAPADVPLFDPDLDELLAPDDMPGAIAAACERLGQSAPSGQGALVRSILISLACKYRLVLERLEAATGRAVEVVHAVGGGARNELLCQLTADVLGRPVLAGPAEATALGNVLVQARGRGELGSLAEMRDVVAASAEPRGCEPDPERGAAEELYGRFCELTGLEPPDRAASAVEHEATTKA